MKKIILTSLLLSCGIVFADAQTAKNPFEKYGFKKVRVFSFSKGEFEEFHDNKEIVEIGSVLYNTKTSQIIGYAKVEAVGEVAVTVAAMSIDPLCEKYPWISPYAFCMNNPVRFIDPDGRDVWEINHEGRIINRIEDKTQDAFYMVSKDAEGNYQRTYTTDAEGNKIYNSVRFEYRTIESQKSISFSPDGKATDTYDVYKVRGDDKGTALYEFLGNNVTGSLSMVEIGQVKTGIEGDKGLNFITTSHQKGLEAGGSYLMADQLYYGYTVREISHTHPRSDYPSNGDLQNKSQINEVFQSQGLRIPNYNIFHVPSKRYISY